MDSGEFAAKIEELVYLSDDALTAALRSAELARRSAEAHLAATIAVAQQRQLHHRDGHRTMKGFLRAHCNWSSPEAARWRSIARAVEWLPGVGDSWVAGRIGHAQVEVFGRLFGNRRVRDRLPEFTPTLLGNAEQLSFEHFDACVASFVAGADEDGAHQDRDTAVEHRNAHVLVNGAELDISAVGGDPITATELQNIHREFEQAEFAADVAAREAEHGTGAASLDLPRSAAQRRFDAVVAIFRIAALALRSQAEGAGRTTLVNAPVVVNVMIDDATFRQMMASAGLLPSVNELRGELGELTGWLSGPANLNDRKCETSDGVPVHPHDVLRAVLNGYVRRMVVDSNGVVVDMGRAARLFTGTAREAAMLLTRTCEHPGCDLPADFCEVDHAIEWASGGGGTDQANARILCGRHNRWKSQQKWQSKRATNSRIYTVRADGTVVLPVGALEPEFEDPVEIERQHHLARQRCRELVSVREAVQAGLPARPPFRW